MHETLQNHNALLNELPETLGATLTRARLSRKLEIREAAGRIGVDVSVIQALEDDDFQHLGAPVFARNFLARYARLLELPEHDILERFRQMGLDEPPPLKVERPIQRQARMTDIRWLAYPVVVVGVMWLSYLGFERLNVHYSSGTAQSLSTQTDDEVAGLPPGASPGGPITPRNDNQTENPGTSPSANPMAPALAAIADLTGFGAPEEPGEEIASDMVILAPDRTAADATAPLDITGQIADAAGDVDTEPASDSAPGETASDLLTTVDLLADQDAIAPDGPMDPETPLVAVANLAEVDDDLAVDDGRDELAALPDGQSQLVLSFNDDCWVEVRDASGERLVRSILNANTVNRFVGEAPFSLTLGNAAAVTSITLNGEPVDQSIYAPVRGNVSRFTLETPSG